ncbi:MAG: MATE family efflux transporter [Gemmatimonadaceae bacterium]|nr:MATE family efflux transporter [Gemmatimonadaceae bacterium]
MPRQMPSHASPTRAPVLVWPTTADMRALIQLALPVMAVEMGMMSMHVVDTLFVGHLSATALAAVSLALIYYFTVVVVGMGTLVGFDALVSQAVGAHDQPSVRRALQRGLVLAAALCVPLALVLWPTEPIMRALHQPAEIVPVAARIVHISILGLPGALAFVVLRQTLQAMERLRPILLAVLYANVLNAACNWLLITGHLGAPALGVNGSAIASVIGRTSLPLLLLWMGRDVLMPLLRERDPRLFDLAPLVRMLRIGAPVGVQYLLEVGVFNAVALLMGMQATSTLAAHQVAINLASFTFMMPLGIGAAAAVLVGQAIGRGDASAARRAAIAALIAGMVASTLTTIIFLAVPRLLASAYVSEPGVIALAATLIPLAGVFQLFDGLQAVAGGALRGAADTRAAMVANILGFWAVGLPLGLWLAFRVDLGPAGLWWGLVAGLAAVSVVLLARLHWRFGGPLTRVHVDGIPATTLGA